LSYKLDRNKKGPAIGLVAGLFTFVSLVESAVLPEFADFGTDSWYTFFIRCQRKLLDLLEEWVWMALSGGVTILLLT